MDGRTSAGTKSKGIEPADEREEREHQRVEGLIAAIAARSRGPHRRSDETVCREALVAGRVTVEDLQTQADELPRRARRGRGPSTPR